MTRYALEQLSEDEFEQLIGSICKHLFGEGVHAFAKGCDAKRDGYFDGKAICYPSTTEPWVGKMIFQAKHTTKLDASCSDNDFFKNDSSVVKKEISALKQILANRKESIDCYLIFTNRKLTGEVHLSIKKYLQGQLGIEKADVIGLEDINRFIECYKDIVKQYHLSEFMMPDRFYEDDIRQVILIFSEKVKFDEVEPKTDENLEYIAKPEKNKINNIDEEYFSEIKDISLAYFKDIENFLKNPMNIELKRKYKNTVADLRGYIHKNIESHSFMSLLEGIIEHVIGNDDKASIYRYRDLVRIFVHYMYWNCDIGRKS